MNLRRYSALLLAAVLVAALFSGCGQSQSARPEAMAPNAMAEEMEADKALGAETGGADLPMPENRKWVITIHMSAETENLDPLLEGVLEQVEALEGYVQDQSIQNGSAYAQRRYRSAQLTLRIPAEKVDGFLSHMEEISNVVSHSRTMEDITLQYVDTETRRKALDTEEKRLLELMEQAQTMSDLLEIEGRLTDVRYEKEKVIARMRTFDNQVDYATIYLSLDEVREYTPVEEPTLWQRISGGFMDSLKGVGEGILNLFVWILASLPYLLVWGAVITGAVILIRRIRRKRKTGKEQKTSE